MSDLAAFIVRCCVLVAVGIAAIVVLYTYTPMRALPDYVSGLVGVALGACCLVLAAAWPKWPRRESVLGVPVALGHPLNVHWDLPTRPCPECSAAARFVVDAASGMVSHLACSSCGGAWVLARVPDDYAL